MDPDTLRVLLIPVGLAGLAFVIHLIKRSAENNLPESRFKRLLLGKRR